MSQSKGKRWSATERFAPKKFYLDPTRSRAYQVQALSSAQPPRSNANAMRSEIFSGVILAGLVRRAFRHVTGYSIIKTPPRSAALMLAAGAAHIVLLVATAAAARLGIYEASGDPPMRKSARLGPPYSILFVSDTIIEGEIEASGRHLEWSDSYVRISCAYCYEKDTSVTVGLFEEVALERAPVFDGHINTPGRQVVVSTAHDDTVLSHNVKTERTRLRIWENDPEFPDELIIAIG